MYTIKPLRGLGAARPIEARICAPDEEFCDDRCVRYMQAWVHNNPSKAACLTNDQMHQIIDTCERARDELASPAEVAASQALLSTPCVDKHRRECSTQIDQWAAANPADAQCLSNDDRAYVRDLCLKWKAGQVEAQFAAAELNRLVAAGCPVPPPQPEPMVPPPIEPPPAPMPVPAPEAVDVVIDAEPAVYTVPDNLFQQREPTPFRKWGPIVGALLIVGGGIYLLR